MVHLSLAPPMSTCGKSTISCPCCYYHHIDSTTIHPPPPVITNLLSALLVICSKGCGNLIRADQYCNHLESKCMGHYHLQTNSPSRMTLRDVLLKPTQVPPTPAEKVVKHLIQRLLNESTEQVISLLNSWSGWYIEQVLYNWMPGE